MFRLNPALDAAAIAERFARERRVQVRDFLAEGAEALHAELRGRGDWTQVVNSGDRNFDLDRPARARMTPDQLRALDEAVYAGARHGFQYRYESVRVPDAAAERAERSDLLSRFAAFLSEGEALDFLRAVTGRTDGGFVDAQATAYSPGDFLTAHHDEVKGKNRIAAYVFGLTPQWRPEWGGLLLFHGPDWDVETGLVPRFNCLNLFAVPQAHSVSEVTRSAANRRYSVTGWLRSA